MRVLEQPENNRDSFTLEELLSPRGLLQRLNYNAFKNRKSMELKGKNNKNLFVTLNKQGGLIENNASSTFTFVSEFNPLLRTCELKIYLKDRQGHLLETYSLDRFKAEMEILGVEGFKILEATLTEKPLSHIEKKGDLSELDDFDVEGFDWTNAGKRERLLFLSLAQQLNFLDPEIGGLINKTKNTIIGFRHMNNETRKSLPGRYKFSEKIKGKFTVKYGKPESFTGSTAKRKRIRSIVSAQIQPEKRGGFVETLLERGRLAFKNKESRKIIEQKFNYLIFLLRGTPRGEFVQAAVLNGISIRSGNPTTPKTKPIKNEEDMRPIPTLDIILEPLSDKDHIMMGLFFLIYSVLLILSVFLY